ncbi:calcineurin-like phosphoesterase 5 [Allopusillimonas soli]|uniref:Metallophosphoesterase n=1 Tax=Allopusillimonas soli TaxID=659016 RepID=A0A853FBG7_9BURK|nr:metallophosphoesterase [Allopusillimonas soli]NYT35891.1 metallophosphoesterase [Allopusillimonas soli]TEA76254.1 calcineurin-like phosphoesterase 5 [Allopusillimonas soli]
MSLVSSSRSPVFSFVVVADTHINEDESLSSSPYQTNALANARARYVFQDIAAMSPAPRFVVHLGDIVHPVPSLPSFMQAVENFRSISSSVKVPIHLVPGNHDVGDKRVQGMPADQVCDAYLDTYRKAFGRDYYAFDEGPLRLVLVNSLLINSGLDEEVRQREWLEEQLSSAGDRRIFLFMHYPPYIYSEDERGNYDNIDQPGRDWLLDLMRRPQVEATFAGHVHNFWYDRVGEGEFYMLPSTAFLRHDFTEFYRTAPDVEFGRGDAEKFGYFIVDVYADGHVAHSVRTLGRQVSGDSEAFAPVDQFLTHPKTSMLDNMGVELRHPWAESMQITATGGVQEFGRKWARNDYPLLALWEMGVKLSKVPVLDLEEQESRTRMQLMARMGHRYVVTTLGLPRGAQSVDELSRAGVAAYEVNFPSAQFEMHRHALKTRRETDGVQIFYSPILSHDPDQYDGQHFNHVIKAGFSLEDLDGVAQTMSASRQAGEIDGVTVRITPDQDLLYAYREMRAFHERTGCEILASLKLAGPSLAKERADDAANVASVAQTIVLSRASSGIRYIYDTFMDVDRGYFPRHAFIDRHFNPRPMARAYCCLNALLSGLGDCQLTDVDKATAESLEFKAGNQSFRLVCATAAGFRQLEHLPSGAAVLDLASGQYTNAASVLEEAEADGLLHVVLITLK